MQQALQQCDVCQQAAASFAPSDSKERHVCAGAVTLLQQSSYYASSEWSARPQRACRVVAPSPASTVYTSGALCPKWSTVSKVEHKRHPLLSVNQPPRTIHQPLRTIHHTPAPQAPYLQAAGARGPCEHRVLHPQGPQCGGQQVQLQLVGRVGVLGAAGVCG